MEPETRENERRRYERIPMNAAIRFFVQDKDPCGKERTAGTSEALAIDISLNGLQMENKAPVKPDTDLLVYFIQGPDDLHFEARSRVVWCRQNKTRDRYRLGLEFC
jgi:c-di-GMP-binding flagellar brake protein YcgR